MKGLATWILVIGGVILGIVILATGAMIISRQIQTTQKQAVIANLANLYSTMKTICNSGGIGHQYFYPIELSEMVRAVYVANESYELPPDKVSVLISQGESNVGDYFCFQLSDENQPRCFEKLLCQTNFTYIGRPSMREDLWTLVARLVTGPPVYSYEVLINKTGENLLNGMGRQMIEGEMTPTEEWDSVPTRDTTRVTTIGMTTSTISGTTTTVLPPVKLKLLIVPVNWDGAFSSYDSATDRQGNYFLERIPLSECPDEFKLLKVDGSTSYGSHWNGWFCHIPGTNSCYDGHGALDNIFSCAEEYKATTGEDYDFVVGIDDSDIAMEDNGCASSVGGWSDGFGGYPSVIAESDVALVTTHEIGHEFELGEQYCDCAETSSAEYCGTTHPVNPLKVELGCSGKGSNCCWNYGSEIYPGCVWFCSGNFDRFGIDTDGDGNLDSGKRSVMSCMNCNSDHFSSEEYDHLKTFQKLQC